MHAETRDELVVRGHVGDEAREGVIIEIHGEKGTPPYLIQWQDGHESVFVPSPTPWWSTGPRCNGATPETPSGHPAGRRPVRRRQAGVPQVMPGGRPGAKPAGRPTCLVSAQRTDEGAISGMAPPF
jgi:uncharacterized protein DUF1918